MVRLAIPEFILRSRESFFEEIRAENDLKEKIVSMFYASMVFLGIYGGVMGASHSLGQIFSSFIKLPFLFLVTLIICAPSLHIFYILIGSKQSIAQTSALILAAISTTSILLLSLAPISMFFLITSNNYEFFKMLNVLFFSFSGVLGIRFLYRGVEIVVGNVRGRAGRRLLFLTWVIMYGFVGSQMAWTLSPFMGRPDKAFMVFHQQGGNFYTDVISTVLKMIGY